ERAGLPLGSVELLAQPLHLGCRARLEPRAERLALLRELVALARGPLAGALAVAQLLSRRGDAPLELDDARPQVVDAIERALALALGLGGLLLGPLRDPCRLADDGAVGLGLRLGARLRLLVSVIAVGDDRLHELRRERAVVLARGAEERPREVARGIARFEQQRRDRAAAALDADGRRERRVAELAAQRSVDVRGDLGVARIVVDERV